MIISGWWLHNFYFPMIYWKKRSRLKPPTRYKSLWNPERNPFPTFPRTENNPVGDLRWVISWWSPLHPTSQRVASSPWWCGFQGGSGGRFAVFSMGEAWEKTNKEGDFTEENVNFTGLNHSKWELWKFWTCLMGVWLLTIQCWICLWGWARWTLLSMGPLNWWLISEG